MRLLLLFIALLACANLAAAASPPTLQIYKAGDEWRPIEWQPARVLKGSALDFSATVEAPAGKHGGVIIKNNQFVFKDVPDKPVRCYGTVISHSLPYQEKAQSDQTAEYLAECGYSGVRLHCYNFAKNVMKEVGSAEFNPEARDKLDYFFHALKKHGIYYTLQINTWAFFKAGDVADVPEFANKGFRFESSGLLPISQDLQKWFKAYALNLFTHVDPYTGLALKDDPAMMSVELENESSILAVLGQFPELVKPYRRLCREHLVATLGRDPTPEEVEKELPLFALELQAKFFQMAKTFLREMGVRQPLTDMNFRDNQVYALPRSKFDYVDIHDYWALYRNLPLPAGAKPGTETGFSQTWANPFSTGWNAYLGAVAGRLFGKPYLCTEYNGCYPSPYWSFVGPVEAVLAGNQEWNGVFRCGPAADGPRFFGEKPVNRIGFSHNPLIMFSERIGSMLYGQGEIQPLPDKLPFVVTPAYLQEHVELAGGPRYPASYQGLAFDYQTGTLLLDGTERLDDYTYFVAPADMKLPAALDGRKVLIADAALANKLKEVFPSHAGKGSLRSDAAKGSGQIVTGRAETFLLSAQTAEAKGEVASVSGNTSVATCFAGSLDGRPLAESHRVLALYLTDLKNSGTEVEDPHGKDGRVNVRKVGELPLLVRQGKVEFKLQHKGAALPKVWALKYDGTRAVALEPRAAKDGIVFDAQAVTSPEVFGVFELEWAE